MTIMRRKVGIIIMVVIVLAMISGFGVWSYWFKGKKAPTFRTVPVKRGDLVATISATGTVEPEEVVDVGAQVAGFDSHLRQGQITGSSLTMARSWMRARCWRELTIRFMRLLWIRPRPNSSRPRPTRSAPKPTFSR